jgi:ATP-dependent Lon protease
MQLDETDQKASEVFDGYIVRKDLVRDYNDQYPVPTYVVEFLLGRYCASTDNEEIKEGLEIVERQLNNRTVRAGNEELFKKKAREEDTTRIIDLVKAKLDTRTDSYVAELPSLQLNNIRIPDELVHRHERMLTGGFYAEVQLSYDPSIAQEENGRPFGIRNLREIQLSQRNVLETLIEGRKQFSTEGWKNFLLRSVGLEPSSLDQRAKDVTLLRMVPFVEPNFNLIELGPRGTGKSYLYQQVSPNAHLVSGGKTTVARMFVNLNTGQRGLVCQYDVVCFDEVGGISFKKKDGINIMKGYMESGEFSRGEESIRAKGSIVMVGNYDIDVEHQLRTSHLFGPLPEEIRNDTAFMDRIHCFVPGWEAEKIEKGNLTDHFGFVNDFLSECWNRLRDYDRSSELMGRVYLGGALSGRDTKAVQKTTSGLIKLLHPDPEEEVPKESLEWAVELALEGRRRVKEQQKRIGSAEFRNTKFSYQLGEDGVEEFVNTPELKADNKIGTDPLPPGQVWTISPGGEDENPDLFRIEVNVGPGSKVKILNKPAPKPFTESVRYAEQNLYSDAKELVGDHDPRSHEFSVQLRSFGSAEEAGDTGVAVLIALCSALLKKSIRGGVVIAGSINVGGSIDPIYNAVDVVEVAAEKGAKSIMVPVSSREQLINLPNEIVTKLNIQYYSEASDVLFKAMQE